VSKQLNEAAMQSELSGSAFFENAAGRLEPATEVSLKQPADLDTTGPVQRPDKQPVDVGTKTPRDRGPTTPRETARTEDDLIETIRRAVKPPGKEDATYRFSAEEKKALADIVYSYGSAGLKTSQNEITRIAINNLLEDYRTNGAQSVLVRVLEQLNA
jgi:hypothetical protein